MTNIQGLILHSGFFILVFTFFIRPLMSQPDSYHAQAMGKKQNKKKIRAEFRKNREIRVRQQDLTRKYQQHGFEQDDSQRSERISGKGELVRHRTVMGTPADVESAGLFVLVDW